MNIDPNRIRKYFEESNARFGYYAIIAGVIALLIGLEFPIFLILALILIGGGGWWIYSQIGNRPTEQEVDHAAQQVIAGLLQRGLHRLGIDQEEVNLIEPLVATGYSFEPVGGELRVKRGKDNRIRSSVYEGVVIYFGEQLLHSYKVRFTLLNPNIAPYEETDEYFYRDVVSISTQSTAVRSAYFEGEIPREELKLTTSGGTSVTSAFENSTSAGNVFQAARQLIRNKKSAIN